MRSIALAIYTFITCSALFAQAGQTTDLIRKARAAGVTQDQIDSYVKGNAESGQDNQNTNQQNQQNSRWQVKDEKTGTKEQQKDAYGRPISNSAINTKTLVDLETEKQRELELRKQRLKELERERELLRDTSNIFGHDFFNNINASFVPSLNIATPKNYILGIGDELTVQLWGSSEITQTEKIQSDGAFPLQGAGPVQLNGFTIEEAEAKIKSRFKNMVSGIGSTAFVKVSVSQIRSIHVNIIGEVRNPGTYTLPGVATLFNALYSAGGISEIGSLRAIELVRNDKTVATFDVYSFLFYGKNNLNIRLEDNDAIIVPAYEQLVETKGAVKRPMKYEMRPNETVANLLKYTGGFKGDAYSSAVTIDRKHGRRRSILAVDSAQYASISLRDADILFVDTVVDLYSNKLTLSGAVWRPGMYSLTDEVKTLSKLIAKADGIRGTQYSSRGFISRLKPDMTLESISFDLNDVLENGKDIELQANDEIIIPTKEEMTELQIISVMGEINKPLKFAYHENMTIEDAIIIAGGLKESASTAHIEVARRIKDPKSTSYSQESNQRFTFTINEDLTLTTETSQFTLKPFDQIYIRRSPSYSEQQNAELTGNVLFAGVYSLNKTGTRLSELLKRAGGITEQGYIRGISVTRKMSEDEYQAALVKVEALRSLSSKKDSLSEHTLKIKDTYLVGVDSEKAINNPGSESDIVLQDGDVINIPILNNTVKISGAVTFANAVTYDSHKLLDYISQAGGYADGARRYPFVIYMSGRVASTRSVFGFKQYPKIEPGCEIVVPNKSNVRNTSLQEIMSLTMMGVNTAAIVANLLK